MGLWFDIDLGDDLDNRVCESCHYDTDEGIDDRISGLLHLLIISCGEDELDPSPCDRHNSEDTREEDKVLDNRCDC